MAEIVVRPTPWAPPPEGFHFEAIEQNGWETPPVGAGRCRWGANRYGKACGEPPAATLWRSRFTRSGLTRVPWDYCADHLYGRWIEDGKVMGWRLVKDDDV